MSTLVGAALFIILLPCAAFAADLKDLSEVRKATDAAMQFVGRDDARGALNSLRAYWIGFPETEIEDAISKAEAQRKAVTPRYGKTVGVQFVEQQVVADSYVRLVYVEKRERHLIRWQFFFYRPFSRWLFNLFHIDDQAQALFH